ncbi:kinase-like protein [Calocera viscosa TUFC12733]|uniref:Kinase-like protein n=1 Tax=Calocera viscosa (strain TUFC12733) TaxID=1330018 RepID=A0A167G110_CALVF|nr:kinase-like protein [Calocera viscosa TUFC12733]
MITTSMPLTMLSVISHFAHLLLVSARELMSCAPRSISMRLRTALGGAAVHWVVVPAMRFLQKHETPLFVKPCRASYQIRSEMSAMRLVRSMSTIPVPRPILGVSCSAGNWIIMARVKGITLGSIIEQIPDENLQRITAQIHAYFLQLREIPSPFGDVICSIDGSAITDERLMRFGQCGPFRNLEAMMDQIGCKLRRDCGPPVFTHGDLACHNIMVDPESGNVTGVIDWEQAMWGPPFWEMVKGRMSLVAYDPNTVGVKRWRSSLNGILGTGFEEELQEEQRTLEWGIPFDALESEHSGRWAHPRSANLGVLVLRL